MFNCFFTSFESNSLVEDKTPLFLSNVFEVGEGDGKAWEEGDGFGVDVTIGVEQSPKLTEIFENINTTITINKNVIIKYSSRSILILLFY